jgi:thymidylate synthase ThyX
MGAVMHGTNEIRVLDHGFVRLDGCMADDLSVANGARVSFAQRSDEMTDREAGLIRFLMRERHGSPFEHNAFRFHIKLPIFVMREWARHRIGCLTGDTEVTFVNVNGQTAPGLRKTMDELWRMWSEGEVDGHAPTADRVRVADEVRRMRLRVLNETTGEFEVGHIRDVIDKGLQPVYELTLADGKRITMTKNHRVLTDTGWSTMREAVGLDGAEDAPVMRRVCSLMVNGLPAYQRGNTPWNKGKAGYRIQYAVTEGDREAIRRARSGERSNFWRGGVASNRTAQGELEFARRFRNRVGFAKDVEVHRHGFKLVAHSVKVVGIRYVGVRHTYDLSVDGPWHNFVANGVVVHNSFNEWSGRYSQLEPEFYVPEPDDVRTQIGKPGSYSFEPVDSELAEHTREAQQAVFEEAYRTYEDLLERGVAKEIARNVLPVAIYTQFYWTVNARSLMNFLSLRNSETAQREIRRYAAAVEELFATKMPVTHAAFVANDRRAP